MKILYYYVIVLCLLSCKTTTVAQVSKHDSTKAKTMTNRQLIRVLPDKPIERNNIVIQGYIKSFKPEKDCRNNLTNILTFEVQKNLEVGQDIGNIPLPNTILNIVVNDKLKKSMTTYKEKTTVSIVLREKLCGNMSKTQFHYVRSFQNN